ncbi:serine dehydratase beta chain, partial [Leifsonia sp. 71-9]
MTAYVSAFDLFSIGIGPSSSHTVGPLRAARAFAVRLHDEGILDRIDQVTCTLYGSLGSTGIGHGTPDAVVAGLRGLEPENCRPEDVRGAWSGLPDGATIALAGLREIPFARDDIDFEPRTRLPGHPNALTLRAWGRGESGEREPLPLREETYYSIGGGFIRRDGEEADLAARASHPLPYDTAVELLAICERLDIPICEVARRNEAALHSEERTVERLDLIWEAMAECVANGLAGTGTLPGGLQVPRRAAAMREHLERVQDDPGRATALEWLHAFALAVNEENA